MWTYRSQGLTDYYGLHFDIVYDARRASFADVIDAWQHDSDFRLRFNDWLAAVPLSAYRWETPPVTAVTANRPFEFVVLDSPGLARTPEPEAFAEQFRAVPGAEVIEFANLSGDATLIVPCPLALPSAYCHLAVFVREAPEAQRHALWQRVGVALARRLGERPVWLSTAGAGVSWLHMRLDDRPKYYGYRPYR